MTDGPATRCRICKEWQHESGGCDYTEGKAPACPFIVVCVDEGAEDRPPALITAHWDGVSDAWEGSDYSTPRADITGLVEAAKKRAGWGGG
jgi:hypothetical protein